MKFTISLAILPAVLPIVFAGGFAATCEIQKKNPWPGDNFMVYMKCRTRDGKSHRYVVYDMNRIIVNNDGWLQKRKGGGHSSSCKWTKINWRGEYSGKCRQKNGQYRVSTLNLSDFVSNHDGCIRPDGMGEDAC